MSTISSNSKVAYIYDAATDTWYPTAGLASTSANYDWTGTHEFSSTATFEDVLNAKAGVNNFQNPAARDAAMSNTPVNGTVVFVRQDNSGNLINQIQYAHNGQWIEYKNVRIDEKTASYTVTLSDLNKLIKVNSTSNLELIIPADATTNFPIGSRIEIGRYGTGNVAVVAAAGSGVTIRSVQNIYAIPYQYASATITKIDANEWWVFFSSFLAAPVTTAPPATTTTTAPPVTTTTTSAPTTTTTTGAPGTTTTTTTLPPTTGTTPGTTTTTTTTTTTLPPTTTTTTTAAPTGIWYTYCGNVAVGYPPGTVVGPVFEAGGNCTTKFNQLTALNEIGSGWNCAPGTSTSSSVAPAVCAVTTTVAPTTTTTTAAPATIWYGTACCGTTQIQASSTSQQAVLDSLEAQCGGPYGASNINTTEFVSLDCNPVTSAPTTTTTTVAPTTTTTTAAPATTTTTTTTAAPVTTTTTAAPTVTNRQCTSSDVSLGCASMSCCVSASCASGISCTTVNCSTAGWCT